MSRSTWQVVINGQVFGPGDTIIYCEGEKAVTLISAKLVVEALPGMPARTIGIADIAGNDCS